MKMILLPVPGVSDSNYKTVEQTTYHGLRNYTNIVHGLISNDVRQFFQLTNYVILCGVISLFGIGGNIVNISVFVRQRFKDSINISLLSLAIADLACSITMFWTSTCHNPLFQNLGLPLVPLDIMYVTGGWPHVCFNRITSFITAFITLERCLCIAIPLKIKNIITPYRTKVLNISIYVSMIILFSPFYFVNKLTWQYDGSRNRTILGLTFTRDREIVESITFLIHSVVSSSMFLLSVTICTIILVVKLNKKTKWRKASVAQSTSRPESASVKDSKVVKMITLISSIFVVCYFPPTIIVLVMVCYPELSISGRYQNIFFVTWSLAFVLEAVNSSVNIFVYFKMSTKYRGTLAELFCKFLKK